MGISDTLRVKLMYKEKGNKKMKNEANNKPSDFSLSSKNLDKIAHLFNRTSTSYIESQEAEMKKKIERERMIQELMEKEGIL